MWPIKLSNGHCLHKAMNALVTCSNLHYLWPLLDHWVSSVRQWHWEFTANILGLQRYEQSEMRQDKKIIVTSKQNLANQSIIIIIIICLDASWSSQASVLWWRISCTYYQRYKHNLEFNAKNTLVHCDPFNHSFRSLPPYRLSFSRTSWWFQKV